MYRPSLEQVLVNIRRHDYSTKDITFIPRAVLYTTEAEMEEVVMPIENVAGLPADWTPKVPEFDEQELPRQLGIFK